MIDVSTKERLVVSNHGTTWPYIMLPLDQVDAVTSILAKHQITYWVDSHAISLNGKPEMIVINLGRGADAEQIQRLMDASN